jgi:hypothetical protein
MAAKRTSAIYPFLILQNVRLPEAGGAGAAITP